MQQLFTLLTGLLREIQSASERKNLSRKEGYETNKSIRRRSKMATKERADGTSRGRVLKELEELLLLALLGHPLYGLKIIEAVAEASEGRRQIGYGSLYPTLHRLQKEGFVEASWGKETPQDRNGARRKYYRTTGLGQLALQDTYQTRANLLPADSKLLPVGV